MIALGAALKSALRSPLLPFWLVVALLPFGRSAELGTFLCLLGVVFLFMREPHALQQHAGARLLLWLLAAYVGAALISAVDAVAPGKTWVTVAGLLRYVPLGLYICFAVRRESRLQALYTAVAVVVVLWAADAWMQALTGWSLGGPAEAERVSGIFGADNLKLGLVLGSLSPFVLWAARERWRRPGLLIAYLFLLGPLLLAGSRAAWLTYGLVGAAFAWRESGTPRRFALWCGGALLLLALGGALAWQVSSPFKARMARTMQVFNVGVGADTTAHAPRKQTSGKHHSSKHTTRKHSPGKPHSRKSTVKNAHPGKHPVGKRHIAVRHHPASLYEGLNQALSGRLDIWQVALRMYVAHPINGVGVRGFRYVYPDYAPRRDHFVVDESCGENEGACHAHQLVLEVATETGTLGLFAWLAALVLAWKSWRRVGAQARARAFPATVALAVTVFPLNTHLAFYSAWWGLLFAWLLALWCAALYVEEAHD